jgi:basic membrane protein A
MMRAMFKTTGGSLLGVCGLLAVGALGVAWAGPARVKPAGLRVGVVFDTGARSLGGFNKMVDQGLTRAVAATGVAVEVRDGQEGTSRALRLQQVLRQGATMVVGVGFSFVPDLLALAHTRPDLKLVCLDCAPPPEEKLPPNLLFVSFADDEAGLLAGLVAGSATKTGHVGFVGAMPAPSQLAFAKGFQSGVHQARVDAAVSIAWVGRDSQAFAQPARGRAVASEMFENGMDVVFHVAGGSGQGVFEAARSHKAMVVGVDADQDAEAPDLVVASVEKRLDLAVEQVLKDATSNSFAGGHRRLGIKEGGVLLVFGAHSPLSKETRARIQGMVPANK